jgi:hypothetical protein
MIFSKIPICHARACRRILGGSEEPSDRSGIVKVLLDECFDWRFARDILGHEIKTARERGDGLMNPLIFVGLEKA